MRFPLFALLSVAKAHPAVPKELRHSGILSLHWIWDHGMRLWMFTWNKPSGHDFIDAIVDRILKNRGPVRSVVVANLRERIYSTIYEASAQQVRYERSYILPLRNGCSTVDTDSVCLYVGSRPIWFLKQCHPIIKAKSMPCRFCGRPVFDYKDAWLSTGVRCNRPACRHIDWLSNKPQKRGGVDLTPRERRSTPREMWDHIRVVHYLSLKAKESNRVKHNQC